MLPYAAVACPFFSPVEPAPLSSAASHALLPLGDAWAGLCHAAPENPFQPGVETLYPICNIGYARARCPRFPGGDAPDAIRFCITADRGNLLQLYYVVERGHLPLAHGALEFSPSEQTFRPTPELEAIVRLARAYIASYFRRKSEASAA